MTHENALPVAATTRQDGNENNHQVNDITFACGLSIGRIEELMTLVDLFNQQFNGLVSMELCKNAANIHVTMCHAHKGNYKFFSTEDLNQPDSRFVYNDTNLEKAEAFLRMLIRSADYCKAMRGIDYVHP